MSDRGSFEFVDSVTSDLSFVARGATLGAVFVAAGDALLAATVERPDALRERTRRSLSLRDTELDILLFRYLNELIFLRDAKQLLLRPQRVSIERGAEIELSVDLAGEALDAGRHGLAAEVKAATLYGLRVDRAADGFEASVTLDV